MVDENGTGAESLDDPTTTEPDTDTTASSGDQPAAESSHADTDDDASHEDSGQDTFPRSYVEKLRRESQGYRERANRATEYAERLHTELVRATGRLADPEDLPFDEAHLEDSDSLSGAIDALLKRKPHLASRRPTGDIGQGASGKGAPVDLAAMLRARA